MQVKTAEEAEAMGKFLRGIAQDVESVERDRKELLAPAQETVRTIKKQIAVYYDEQRRIAEDKRKEEEQKRQIEWEKERKKQVAAAAKKHAKAPPPPPPPPPVIAAEPPKQISGTTQVRMVWTYEVVPGKEAEIPREYLALDSGLVRRAIQDGKREIPGLRIFQKPSVAV
jgi:hypothetical protein